MTDLRQALGHSFGHNSTAMSPKVVLRMMLPRQRGSVTLHGQGQ